MRAMGVGPWVDREHFPLLLEVEGTPCVLSSLLFPGRLFCTNAHCIYWIIGAIFVKFSQLILVNIIIVSKLRGHVIGAPRDSQPPLRSESH